MNSKLHSNLWKYALILISKKRIFVAILGAYYLTVPDVQAADIGLGLVIQYFSYLVGFLVMAGILVCSVLPLYIYIRRTSRGILTSV